MRRLAHHRALPRGHRPRRRLICGPVGPPPTDAPPTAADIVGAQWTTASHARSTRPGSSWTPARSSTGRSDPATFDAMLQLGRTLRDAGQLREAERVLTTSLSLQNRSDGTDDGRVARTEFNLAIVVDRLGEHEAARRLWERVLQASDTGERPRQRAVRADGRQPGHHPAQTPPLRRRVPAAGARARVDAADLRPGQRRDLPGHDRPGPDASASRQPRPGARPVHRGARRAGTHRRGPAHHPLPEVGHRHGAGGAQAVEGGRSDVRPGRGRRRGTPGARRSLPAQRIAAAPGVLAPRQVLRARPEDAPGGAAGRHDRAAGSRRRRRAPRRGAGRARPVAGCLR